MRTGLPNRKALGWKDTGDGKYTDASQAPGIGADITRWQIPGGKPVPANLPKDYLLLGARTSSSTTAHRRAIRRG